MVKLQINLIAFAFVSILTTTSTTASEKHLHTKRDSKEKGPPQVYFLIEKSKHPIDILIPHRFSFNKRPQTSNLKISRKSTVPELQVGCGEGLLRTESASEKERKFDVRKLRSKRDTEARKKRGFYPYPGRVIQAPPVQSYSYYNPPVYQITRPYVIPIWGAPGKVPVYLNTQPIYTNPGFPHFNPPVGIRVPDRSYLPVPPRGYLPPDGKPEETSGTEVDLNSRFKGDNDDRPIWDSNFVEQQQPSNPKKPTRKPQRLTTTPPPLIHRNSSLSNSEPSGNQLRPEVPAGLFTSPPPTKLPPTPPPPIQDNRLPSVSIGGGSDRRPVSRCVWAIISCCSADSVSISYNCFEQLGCSGAFWGSSPCESDFARAAISAALNYYN